MRIAQWYFVVIVLISSIGCEKRFTDIDEYEKYVRSDDSPYVQHVIKNGVKVRVRYLPTDVLLIQNYRHYKELEKQMRSDTSLTPAQREQALREAQHEIRTARETYNNSLYITMTIGYEDGKRDIEYERTEGATDYGSWLDRLLFRMNEYIFIETPTIHEVPLALYNMDRSFGITKDRSFLLMFARHFNEQDLLEKKNSWIKLHVKEFGSGTGGLTFELPLPISKAGFESGV